MRFLLYSLLWIAVTSFPVSAQEINSFFQEELGEIDFDFGRWPYPLYEENGARLRVLADQYPGIATLHVIGQTQQGRDMLLMEITNKSTGPGEDKPGMWLDGNMHASEVNGRPTMMYFIERALSRYGKDEKVTRLVDTRAFYVLPMFDADGGERVLTRHPAWPEHKPEQHNGKDLDGDGFISQMRKKDPNGRFYESRKDSRLMLNVRRRNGSRDNYFPTTYSDTLFFNWQEPDIGWKRNSGPFPFYIPELRAAVKFITDHKNIFFHYNIHADNQAKNYKVRPPMDHPYEFMPPEDNEFYVRLGQDWAVISNDDLKIYETCPRQYQFFREYDFTPSRSAVIFFGLLVHQTIEEIHRIALDGKLDTLDEPRIRDLFDRTFSFLVTSDVRPIGDKAREAALRQVLNYFHQNRDEMRRVIQAEVDVSLEKDGYILAGKVDLLLGGDGKLELLDFKTSPRPKDSPELIAAYERQLCTYAEGIISREARG